MTATLRAAAPADAGPAGAICYEAFKTISERHGFPPDFPNAEIATGLIAHLISREDIYSVVAEADGRLAGSNFLWEDEAAGVGPITVDPAAQNRRVGRQLMESVLRRARERDFQSVRLVQAAYHSRSLSLYTRLGFDAREPLSLMQGPPLNLRVDARPVRAATDSDFEAANDLCRRVYGFSRSIELRLAIEQRAAAVVESNGRLTGYTSGIGFMTHSVGETDADIEALIGAADGFAGPGFLLPTRNATLLRWCLDKGLRIVQPLTLMTMGPYDDPKGAYLPSILY